MTDKKKLADGEIILIELNQQDIVKTLTAYTIERFELKESDIKIFTEKDLNIKVLLMNPNN